MATLVSCGGASQAGKATSGLAPECTRQVCLLPPGLTVTVWNVERNAAPLTSHEALPHNEFYVHMVLRLHISQTYQTASGFIAVTPRGTAPAIDNAQLGYNGTFPQPSSCSIPPVPVHEPVGTGVGPPLFLSKGADLGSVPACVIVKGDPSEPLALTWWITLLHK
jgi:hypothetical protein